MYYIFCISKDKILLQINDLLVWLTNSLFSEFYQFLGYAEYT